MFQKVKLIALAIVCSSGAALAGMTDTENLAPYEICALCHALNGDSHMSKFPKLAGQPQAYLEKQLADFLAGRRSNDGGQMEAIVTEIAPENFPVVAEWFAGQPAPPPVETDANISSGEAAFSDLGCSGCHDRAIADGITPHLTAQHSSYLVKQMIDFRDGNRANDLDGTMRLAMEGVTDVQIDALAVYLSSTPRVRQ